MGSNPSFHRGDDLPVHNVSWNECQVFLRKLNSMTKLNFRLPTEIEWEYAAKGGNESQSLNLVAVMFWTMLLGMKKIVVILLILLVLRIRMN